MPTSPGDGNTHKDPKRSQLQETVSVAEAAKLLGVTDRTVRNYIDNGVLHRVGPVRLGRVLLHDITAFAPILAKCFDFAAIARTTLRAMVTAVRAERRLDRLEALMGIDSYILPTDEVDVQAFHLKCTETALSYTTDFSANDVLQWAYSLSAITEEYLQLVELVTYDNEPWAPYMELGRKLVEAAPKDMFSKYKDLEVAYAYLNAGRRHLRQVAYFYIRNKHGAKKANDAYPEVQKDTIDSDILSLLFMHAPAAPHN